MSESSIGSVQDVADVVLDVVPDDVVLVPLVLVAPVVLPVLVAPVVEPVPVVDPVVEPVPVVEEVPVLDVEPVPVELVDEAVHCPLKVADAPKSLSIPETYCSIAEQLLVVPELLDVPALLDVEPEDELLEPEFEGVVLLT